MSHTFYRRADECQGSILAPQHQYPIYLRPILGRQGKVLDKVSSEDNTAGIRLDSGRLGTGSNATNQDTRLKEKPSLIFSYNRNVFIQILIVDIGVNSLL